MVKICENCKYQRKRVDEYPCSYCGDVAMQYWEPKNDRVERVNELCARCDSCEECPVNADVNTNLLCQMKPFHNMPDDWLDDMLEVFGKGSVSTKVERHKAICEEIHGLYAAKVLTKDDDDKSIRDMLLDLASHVIAMVVEMEDEEEWN